MKAMRILSACVLAVALAGTSAAQFYNPPSTDIATNSDARIPAGRRSGIRIDQKLGTVVSPDWQFTDHAGKSVTTGELMSKRPTLLLMIFYKCTGVCATELLNAQKLIRGFKKDNAGELYDLVVVSIDPSEKPEQAAQKRQEFIDSYKRPGTEDGLHFLVGDAKNIDGLADEIGFRFQRDEANNQITHPAGLMVLSPDRQVVRYFVSDEFEPRPVLLAIKDAREGKIGERDDRPFFLSCINVDPLTGQRSLNILNTVRTGGAATVLVLMFWIISMNRSTKKQMETAFEQEGKE